MSKKIDWIPNADLPVGKGATRQEYDAKVGADQLVIETTPWGDGDLSLNGEQIGHIRLEKTQSQAFQALEQFAEVLVEDEADPVAPNPVDHADTARGSGPASSPPAQTIAPAPSSQRATAGKSVDANYLPGWCGPAPEE